MAQIMTMASITSPMKALQAKNLAIAVPQAGSTVLLTVPCQALRRIFATFTVSTFLLAGFKVLSQPHADSVGYTQLYGVSGDYTSPKGLIVGVSGDLTVQAAASTGWIVLDVFGLWSIQFQANSGNAGGSAIDVYCGGA